MQTLHPQLWSPGPRSPGCRLSVPAGVRACPEHGHAACACCGECDLNPWQDPSLPQTWGCCWALAWLQGLSRRWFCRQDVRSCLYLYNSLSVHEHWCFPLDVSVEASVFHNPPAGACVDRRSSPWPCAVPGGRQQLGAYPNRPRRRAQQRCWWLFMDDGRCLDLQSFGISFAGGTLFPPCQTRQMHAGGQSLSSSIVPCVKGTFSAPADSSRWLVPCHHCAGFESEMPLGGCNCSWLGLQSQARETHVLAANILISVN